MILFIRLFIILGFFVVSYSNTTNFKPNFFVNKKKAESSVKLHKCQGLFKNRPDKVVRKKNIQTHYSINFMWLNKNMLVGEGRRYIVPEAIESLKIWDDVILSWARLHPKAVINIWYDSSKVTGEAIQNTKRLCNSFNRLYKKFANIQIRDVLELDIVKQNPFICSDRLPVYYRADLLRLIATYEDLKNKRTKYFVYADLDMRPILHLDVSRSELDSSGALYDLDVKFTNNNVVESVGHGDGLVKSIPYTYSVLFSPSTLESLEIVGFVVRSGGYLGFENSFHIASSANKKMMAAIKKILIDLNIERARNFLDGRYSGDLNPETIYTLYSLMFLYYLHSESMITLLVELDQSDITLEIDTEDDESLWELSTQDEEIKYVPYEKSYGISCFPSQYLKTADGFEFQLQAYGVEVFKRLGKRGKLMHDDLYQLLPKKITPYHPIRHDYFQ